MRRGVVDYASYIRVILNNMSGIKERLEFCNFRGRMVWTGDQLP